jgi:hypothetical protein
LEAEVASPTKRIMDEPYTRFLIHVKLGPGMEIPDGEMSTCFRIIEELYPKG